MTCVFKQWTVSLSLMTCGNMQGQLSSLKFGPIWKYSQNSSLDMKTEFNHVTVEALSSSLDTTNKSWNVILTILAVNVYHTWNSPRGPRFALDPGWAPKRCGRQKFWWLGFSQFAVIVFLFLGSYWCLLDFLHPIDWTRDINEGWLMSRVLWLDYGSWFARQKGNKQIMVEWNLSLFISPKFNMLLQEKSITFASRIMMSLQRIMSCFISVTDITTLFVESRKREQELD